MHLDPAVVPIEHRCGTSSPDSLDARSLSAPLIVILSRGAIGRTAFAPLYDLISSSTLTFDRRDRVRSFTGSGEEQFAPWSFDTPSQASERASELVISVDRFFVEDAAAYKIARAEKRRQAGGCHRSRSSCNRTEPYNAVAAASSRSPYDTPAYATNRSTWCFTTAREIGPRGVCDAVAPAAIARGQS